MREPQNFLDMMQIYVQETQQISGFRDSNLET